MIGLQQKGPHAYKVQCIGRALKGKMERKDKRFFFFIPPAKVRWIWFIKMGWQA